VGWTVTDAVLPPALPARRACLRAREQSSVFGVSAMNYLHAPPFYLLALTADTGSVDKVWNQPLLVTTDTCASFVHAVWAGYPFCARGVWPPQHALARVSSAPYS
jgi:hypothetical protein